MCATMWESTALGAVSISTRHFTAVSISGRNLLPLKNNVLFLISNRFLPRLIFTAVLISGNIFVAVLVSRKLIVAVSISGKIFVAVGVFGCVQFMVYGVGYGHAHQV